MPILAKNLTCAPSVTSAFFKQTPTAAKKVTLKQQALSLLVN